MSPAERDRLRSDGALLRSIISRKVVLKRSGREWQGLCPFHGEKSPSFTVYDDGHYHCYGCGAHGSVFDYVMQSEGVDFPEACRRVAAEAGIASPPTRKPNGVHKGDDLWQPMVPPPPDAPRPTDHQLACDMLHEYRAPDDGLLLYVKRIEAKGDRRKQFYPLTYGTLNGKTGWHDKGPAAPRPLYRLNALSHAPADAPVLLCEGEKAADAAQRILLDYVAMTWLGGAEAAKLADLTPLTGRSVILWPDADEIGLKAMAQIAARLSRAQVVDTIGLPDGFDAADLEALPVDPDEWLSARIRGIERPSPTAGRILTGADFTARHVPPVWLIDGVVQRSRLYACTSLTGHGKTAVWLFNACMIHAGRMIGQQDVFQGNVLFLAGENPADLEARMIGMARDFDLPLERLPYVLPGSFPLTEEEADALKRDIAGLGVPLALIIGDTASSFFPGEDENSNVQAGQYARTLRTLSECKGNPAVMVLCHPIKNASRSNLIPRGGGAFLNELDGNLTLWSESRGEVTELHWQGKIRGPDFSPLGYRLRSVDTGLTDEKGRPEKTIIAEPMSEEAVADHAKQTLANEDVVLRALHDHPDWSYAQIARDAGWVDDDDQPMKPRVQRAIHSLAEDKLVTQPRKGARWELTDKGKKAAGVTSQD
jgi:hypothetical protein